MNPCCVMYGEGGLAARCDSEETAAQIIREHNAHDDMVEACKRARQLLCAMNPIGLQSVPTHRAEIHAMDVAIAKATEVKPV